MLRYILTLVRRYVVLFTKSVKTDFTMVFHIYVLTCSYKVPITKFRSIQENQLGWVESHQEIEVGGKVFTSCLFGLRLTRGVSINCQPRRVTMRLHQAYASNRCYKLTLEIKINQTFKDYINCKMFWLSLDCMIVEYTWFCIA